MSKKSKLYCISLIFSRVKKDFQEVMVGQDPTDQLVILDELEDQGKEALVVEWYIIYFIHYY